MAYQRYKRPSAPEAIRSTTPLTQEEREVMRVTRIALADGSCKSTTLLFGNKRYRYYTSKRHGDVSYTDRQGRKQLKVNQLCDEMSVALDASILAVPDYRQKATVWTFWYCREY